MFIQDRNSARRFFTDVWLKYRNSVQLEPMERLVLEVILEHPEYHRVVSDPEAALGLDTGPETGETNPFLHMGMHIAIREQVQADRPAGIREMYQSLIAKGRDDQHNLEHKIMECLGEVLWTAQQNNSLPDENRYMDCIKKIKAD